MNAARPPRRSSTHWRSPTRKLTGTAAGSYPHPLERGVQAEAVLVPADRRDRSILRPVGARNDCKDDRDRECRRGRARSTKAKESALS